MPPRAVAQAGRGAAFLAAFLGPPLLVGWELFLREPRGPAGSGYVVAGALLAGYGGYWLASLLAVFALQRGRPGKAPPENRTP